MNTYHKIMPLLLTVSLSLGARPALLGADSRLDQVSSFAFGLGLDLTEEAQNKLRAYDLVVLDGTDTDESIVNELQEGGTIVLGYASVGTIERNRPWTKRLKKRFSIGYWKDWDEYFAAVSKRGFRRFFLRKIAKPILDRGFDGLFLDNVDMISVRRKQTRGMIRVLKQTGALLGDSRFLFIQNGDSIIEKLRNNGVEFHGWNREDVTSTYNFDTEAYEEIEESQRIQTLSFVSSMIELGYFVTTTDYTENDASSISQSAIQNSCAIGSLPFVSDIFLTRLSPEPFRCD